MSWSMFAINFLDINALDKAHIYFQRAYKDYVRPEFKVWSENKIGYQGSANFLTGIGGFLQAIINGYGGIRFDLDGHRSLMKLQKPNLIAGTKGFTIHGIKFAGSKFSLMVHANGTSTFRCLETGRQDIELSVNCHKYAVYANFSIHLEGKTALLYTV